MKKNGQSDLDLEILQHEVDGRLHGSTWNGAPS
jgi:hypothetical protein